VPFAGHADVTKPRAEADPRARVAEAERKAKAREKRGPAPSALDDAREQMALDAAQPYWPFHLAELELAADSAAAGEASLGAALARDPDYAPALALLSKRLYETRRHEEAVTLLEASRARLAARSQTMSGDLLAGLALHLEALGRSGEAREALAAAPHADRAGTRGALVYLMLRGDHPDSATVLAASAVDDDPKSAVGQNNFGITRLRAGDPAAAKQAFLKAVDLDPSLPGPYYNLAILEKFYLFDDTAAARWFDAYRQRGRTDPDSLAQVFAKVTAVGGAGK
jgi:tetratricopeptide (TPR) repeat protein